MNKLAFPLATALVLAAHVAGAQCVTPCVGSGGFTITTPGEAPTFYNPNPIGGGGTFTTPGQPTTFYNPNPLGGGGTLTTSGQPTRFINPNPLFGR